MYNQQCKICKCTEEKACEGGCSWANLNTCTNCVGIENYQREYLARLNKILKAINENPQVATEYESEVSND